MDASRFDQVARHFAARRLSRRSALVATSMAASLIGGLAHRARAQGSPPAATPAARNAAENNATLFVQTGTGGTLQPNPRASHAASPVAGTPTAATPGAYLLTLQGHSGETIGFSDRPQRTFGEVKTTEFFAAMGFTPINPPNAALVADTPQQTHTVTLLELTTAHFDASTRTLTYEANLLHQYPNVRGNVLTPLAAKAQHQAPPASFQPASLFIDDCADQVWGCFPRTGPNPNGAVGYVTLGSCWSWLPPGCDWSNCSGELDPDSRCNQSGFDCGDQGCLACTTSPIAVATGEGGECL